MNDLPFLRRVDLDELDTFVVEKDLHVVEEELVRVRVRNVKAEVIDELLLFRLPFSPAVLADLGTDLLSELGRYRRDTERFVLLPTACALEFVTTK